MTFPEHKHVWEVLLVSDSPVGVTCKICDQTFHMTESVPPPTPPVVPSYYLDLYYGSTYTLRLNGMVQQCRLTNTTQRSGGQGLLLTVEFDVPVPGYAAAPSNAVTYATSNTYFRS